MRIVPGGDGGDITADGEDQEPDLAAGMVVAGVGLVVGAAFRCACWTAVAYIIAVDIESWWAAIAIWGSLVGFEGVLFRQHLMWMACVELQQRYHRLDEKTHVVSKAILDVSEVQNEIIKLMRIELKTGGGAGNGGRS